MILDQEIINNDKLFLSQRITIASYPGGKSDKKKHLPLFATSPNAISYLVEPFAGLANYFLVSSPHISEAWLNDKDPEVYALLRSMKEKELLLELIEYVQAINPVERDDYYTWKEKNPQKEIERAVRKLVILNCSPNGAGGGYSKEKAHRKWYINKPIMWKQIHKIFSRKVTKITNNDYLEVLKQCKQLDPEKAFLYLDPPYFDVAKKGNLYGKELNVINWQKIKEVLQSIDIPFILSNRDVKEMREEFNCFYLFRYNTYNDMNNTRDKNPELMISNIPFQFQKTQQGLNKWIK